ncbi:MAG: glycine dehydrogenase, partial [bacterium]
MLHHVGLNSADELFHSIPQDLRLSRNLNTPAALSEIELMAGFERLAEHNRAAKRTNFLGAGAYQHYIPSIVDHIISRSEFFTAYTPYQPEISQGTLQAIFEFQTLVC